MKNINDMYSYSKGRIDNTMKNIITYLSSEPKYAGKLKMNLFTSIKEFDGERISDDLISDIVGDIEEGLGFYNPAKVRESINKMLRRPENQYNPVIDYLKSLAWDGNKRVETMFIDWFKADDTLLNRAYAMKWMRAAVKRAIEPGCKFDGVVLLQGAQGIGKSNFCKRLSAGFGSVNIRNIDDPEKYVHLLNQSWICIIDELRGFTKKEQETIKGFLADTEDTARLSYERNSQTYKRHCVFIGSTNNETFLNDYSQMTERRYWIVKCNATEEDGNYLFDNFTQDVVDQLWAEAYYLYKKDPDYDLELETSLKKMLKEDQKQYKSFVDDPTYEFLKNILTRKYPSKEFEYDQFKNMVERPSEYNGVHEIDRIPVRFINNILSESKCTTTRSTAWLKTVMEELGWKKCTCWYKGTDSREMCWKKIDDSELFNDEE